MLVCHCNAVSDAAVAEAVSGGAVKVGQVVRSTRAGTVCGGCIPELRRLCREAVTARLSGQPETMLRTASLAG
jgi:bacterioferritin-associated ferredoxin